MLPHLDVHRKPGGNDQALLQSTLHGIPRQRIVSIFGVLVPPLW